MTANEFNSAVDEWADKLFRFALKSIGDSHDAKDIVQLSFETLWIHISEVPLEKCKSYLFTVAYRKCMDIHRMRKRTQFVPDIPEAISDPDYKKENREYIDIALLSLDEQSKTLILLKDYEGYNYDEICKITLLSLAQVKVYLHRARKNLKNYLVENKQII